MTRLTHFRLCPLSRSIRLALGELDIAFEMVEERAWEWPASFLALNPAGELPVLEIEGEALLCGVYSIVEYLAEDELGEAGHERRRIRMFPGAREERAEVRRLVDWFHRKLDREVSRELMAQKVHPQVSRLASPGTTAGPAPDPSVLRAIRANMRQHLAYVDFLSEQRRWLAGEAPSFADLAAASHLSCADYVGEVPWQSHPAAKAWYSRLKSRPSFRPLLADRIPGMAPPPHYADLDF